MRVFLKTYFYAPHEMEFIVMNLLEMPVDTKMILCECDIHHTGRPNEMLGHDYVFETIPEELHEKVLYVPCHVREFAVDAYNNENLIHQRNEPLMRSYFLKACSFLQPDDVIISVDADEVIYNQAYGDILQGVRQYGKVRLPLHQFFYHKNWLWKNKIFKSPVATQVKNHTFPCNIRDEGRDVLGIVGCHFSWCMPVDAMIKKLHCYSHPKYRNCADRDILETAIRTKTYPFDPSVRFELEELDWTDERLPEILRTTNV